MRVLFVGEQRNAPTDGPAFEGAYPGRSASRLATMLGTTVEDMHDRFEFVNLLAPGTWSAPLAEQAVCTLVQDMHQARYDRVILLGRKVHRAFFRWTPPYFTKAYFGDCAVLCFPHPSGRNRLLNDPAFKRRASRVLRRFVK